jgi:hypothetical protein
MNRTLVPRTLVPLVLVPLALLVGCGSTTQSVTPPSAAPATTVTATPPISSPSGSPSISSSADSPAGLKPPTSTKEVKVEHAIDVPSIVTRVRFAEHGGFDRVVIDLEGDIPGYTVEWVPELVQDGSGDPIDVKGGAYLQLSMNPANAHSAAGEPTWTGGPIFQAGLGNVQNVVKTGDFEAVVGVGVVLDHKAAFRVLEQKAPNRLVIDVAH